MKEKHPEVAARLGAGEGEAADTSSEDDEASTSFTSVYRVYIISMYRAYIKGGCCQAHFGWTPVTSKSSTACVALLASIEHSL